MPISGKGTVFLVDGSGFIFRAFHALPYLSNGRGLPTNALYGYLQMLLKLTKEYRPDYLGVAFDDARSTFRGRLDPNYKATRKDPPDDLRPQFPFFRPLVEAFNIPAIGAPDFEADDVIAALTRDALAAGKKVVIVSSDKDLMQLVDGDRVVMLDTLKDRVFGPAEVEEKFGVPPDKVAEVLALMGDSSDNIPGVRGIGPKTAAELIKKYGDVEGVIAHAGELPAKKRDTLLAEADNARLSRKLVGLALEAPVPPIEELRRREPDLSKLDPLLRELDFAKHLKELAPRTELDRSAYRTVTTSAQLDELGRALGAAPTLAVEVVCDGDGPLSSDVIGLAVAAPGVAPAYVPFAHGQQGQLGMFSATSRKDQLPLSEVARVLGPLLADPARPKLGHDVKRLRQAATRLGLSLGGTLFDAMIASYLTDGSRPGHDLETLAQLLLQHRMVARDEICGKGKAMVGIAALAPDAVTIYACERAHASLALEAVLRPQLTPELAKLETDLELPLADVLARVEEHGVRLDTAHLAKLGAKMETDLAALQLELDAAAGHPLNIGSPKQLQDFLFNKLGLAPNKKTKTGFSTDARTLQELAPGHPIVDKILEHRALSKLKGTYVDTLPAQVSRRTGRLHTYFNQAVASTGRLSSESPNLQNIPIRTELGREIRRAFIAEPGAVLVSADYSQIELRVVAHLAHDQALIGAFLDPSGIDVHTRTAAEVFQLPQASVTGEQRRIAKAVNYAVMYGQGDFGLSQVIHSTRDEAKQYIDRYFATYTGIRDYMQRVIAEARETGVSTTILGRRRPLPDLRSPNFQARSAAERMARNTPIQGSAADILKLAMIRVDRRLTADPALAGARLLLTVHDELVFEVPAAAADALVAAARAEMEQAIQLDVPLVVDVTQGRTWADIH